MCWLKCVTVERGFEVAFWSVIAKPHSLRLHIELCGKLLPVIIFGKGWSFSSGLVQRTQKHFSPLSVMWRLCLGRKPRSVSHSVLCFLSESLSFSLWLSHIWSSKNENLTFICWPLKRLDKANGTSAPHCLCSFHFIILCLAGHISWDKLDSSFSELGFYLSLIEFLFDQTSLSWPMSLPVFNNLLGKGD